MKNRGVNECGPTTAAVAALEGYRARGTPALSKFIVKERLKRKSTGYRVSALPLNDQ